MVFVFLRKIAITSRNLSILLIYRKTSVSVSTSEQTRVERLRLSAKELERLASQSGTTSVTAPRRNLTPRPRAISIGGSSNNYDPFTTPEPPTTPSSEPGNIIIRGVNFRQIKKPFSP